MQRAWVVYEYTLEREAMERETLLVLSIWRAVLRRSGSICVPLIALAALPAPAAAQETESATASVTLIEPLTLTKLRDMDFGSVFTDGAGGTVIMTPSHVATCTPSATMGHSGACQSAEFAGYGQSGRQIRVKLPGGNRITLAGPGAPIELTDMTVDGTPEVTRTGQGKGFVKYRIDELDGGFSFRVGGTITIAAGQAPGVYTASFEVRVEYD